VRRVRELSGPVTQLLGVKSVWCETKVDNTSQKFVLWAGYLLEKRQADDFRRAAPRRTIDLEMPNSSIQSLIKLHDMISSSSASRLYPDLPPQGRHRPNVEREALLILPHRPLGPPVPPHQLPRLEPHPQCQRRLPAGASARVPRLRCPSVKDRWMDGSTPA